MKLITSIALFFFLNLSFSQLNIKYNTVFEKGVNIVNDLSCELSIKFDSTKNAKSFTFLDVIQDTIKSNEITVSITKSQPVFKEGHVGVLYHGFNKDKVGYFVYMMDDYCVLYYLPAGKTNFSDSKTLYTLMGGKEK